MCAKKELRFGFVVVLSKMNSEIYANRSESEEEVWSSTMTPCGASMITSPTFVLDSCVSPAGDLIVCLQEPVAMLALWLNVCFKPSPQFVEMRIERERDEWLVVLECPTSFQFDLKPPHWFCSDAKVRNRREFPDQIPGRDKSILESHVLADLVPAVSDHSNPRRVPRVFCLRR